MYYICADVNRAMKMLAILQVRHMVETNRELTAKLYQMSILLPDGGIDTNGRDLSWPFMCVAIGFTKEAIQALRSGGLNKDCNAMKDVLPAVHEFQQACFYEFGKRLTDSPVLHHAVHLAAVRESCKNNPASLLKHYRAAAAKQFADISVASLLASLQGPTSAKSKSSGLGLSMSLGLGKSSSKPKQMTAPMRASGGNSSTSSDANAGAVEARFDDLEAIVEDGAGGGEKPEKKSLSKSIWSSLTGGKASKFKI
jgi:hypothetical protein